MPLIECLLGPTEQTIGGRNYNFCRDAQGRFVATVETPHHIACLLSTGVYRLASSALSETDPQAASKIVPAAAAFVVPTHKSATAKVPINKANAKSSSSDTQRKRADKSVKATDND